MIGKKVKKLLPIFALLFAAALLQSCNRGMGCPSNFKAAAACTTVLTGK